MKNFFVFEREFCGACILTARAGTNGLQGGDAGHSGKAVVDLKNDGGDFEFIKYSDKWIRIIAPGDSEIEELLNALKWVCKTLEREIEINNKG